MKKNLGFMVSVVLLLVVGGAVAYFMMEDEKPLTATPPSETLLFKDGLKGVNAASIIRTGEEPIKLVQTTPPPAPEAGIGEWRITSPANYKADPMMMGEWLGVLRTLDAERALEAPGPDATGFGFEAPMMHIELVEGVKTRTLEVGAVNPGGASRYARLTGSPKLYLLAVGSITTLNKSLADLRQKRALDATVFAVEKLRIEAPGGVREIVRTPTRDWTFASPVEFRADQTMLSEFATTLIGARADAAQLAQPPVAEGRFRAMIPVATVTASTQDGEVSAEFRRDKDNTLYAKSDDLGGIYPVQTELENYLKKPVEEFRNTKLFDFGFADVFTLGYESPSRKLEFTKPNEQWELDGQPTDSAKANKLLDELRSAVGSAFVEGEAPGSAVATIRLETAGGAKEHVELRRGEAGAFAVRVGEKGYYKLPENVLKDIEKAAAEIPAGGNR